MHGLYNRTYKLIAQINALSLREQLLLMVTGMVGIIAFLYEITISPNISSLAAIKEQQRHLIEEGSAYYDEIAFLTVTQKKQHEQLKRENRKLEKQLQALDPVNMGERSAPKVLASILSDFKGLELVSLEGLPPEAPQDNSQLIKLPYELHFVGQFPEMIKYLYKLKADVPTVYWDKFEYKIKSFPDADIRLTLFTVDYEKNKSKSSGGSR
tara:strand:- start:71076 stop:71708 length:633 start_codon:yes stop_codon:yes gene_type:complete